MCLGGECAIAQELLHPDSAATVAFARGQQKLSRVQDKDALAVKRDKAVATLPNFEAGQN